MNNPVATEMFASGFEAWDTGGGCQAWGKNFQGYQILVTDYDNGLGEKENEYYCVGLYRDGEGEQLATADANNLYTALELASECQSDPAKFIETHPYQPCAS